MNQTTFNQTPVIYSVTWTQNSPTNYSTLTGDQAGGLDPAGPQDYNQIITVTGNTAITTTVMSAGENILINNVSVVFSSTDTLANIITKINTVSNYTKVIADQRVSNNYLTLSNKWEYERQPFWIGEGSGSALSKLGFVPGSYSGYPSVIGSTFTNVSINSVATINGVDVVFTIDNSDTTMAAKQINSYSNLTGVGARPAGPFLQMYSITPGQPWAINQGTAVSNLGFTVGNYGGFPTTTTQSTNLTRGNMRWDQVVNELTGIAPIGYIGAINKTGSSYTGGSTMTTVQFSVAIAGPHQISTIARTTEPDSGTVLMNDLAIKRAVARAMTSTIVKNQMTFDPTISSVGAKAVRYNPASINSMTAAALDSNVIAVGNNITVTRIS